MSRKRKRIVGALLLAVAFSLGAACYLQLTRTTGNGVAYAALATPPVTSDVVYTSEIGSAGTALYLPAVAPTRPAPATAMRLASATHGSSDANPDEGEFSTLTMESVDMPATSIVLASAADNSGSRIGGGLVARRNSFGYGAGGYAGGAGGSGTPEQDSTGDGSTGPDSTGSSGSGSSGSAEPEGGNPAGNTGEGSATDETPSDPGQPPNEAEGPGDSGPPTQNDPPRNNDEGEGEGEGPGEGPGGPTGEDPPLVNDPPADPPPYHDGPYKPPHGDKPVSVPEPSTLALLGAGLAALGFGRRRRKPQ